MLKNSYKLKQKISICGETIDDKKVIRNSFIFMSTLGLPFDVLIQTLNDNGFTIDYEDFCKSAIKDGWKKETIYNKLTENIKNIYENHKEFEIKLKETLDKL